MRTEGKSYIPHQAHYAKNLTDLSIDCTFDMHRARRHEIALLAHTGPCRCPASAFMARITSNGFDKSH